MAGEGGWDRAPKPAAQPAAPTRRTVLVFAEFGTLNGGERSFLSVVPEIARRGWQFVIAAPHPSEFSAACIELGLDVIPFAYREDANRRRPLDPLRADAASLITAQRPNLVHANSLSTARLFAPVAAEQGLPTVGFLRDIMNVSPRVMRDLNRLTRAIAVSQATADHHCQRGLDPARVRVLYNGVDLATFCPLAGSEIPDAPNRIRKLLFVGQLGMRKGIDLLLQALVRCQDRLPPFELSLAGVRLSQKKEAIEYEQRLRELARPLQRVRWLGLCNSIASQMRHADLLIHPARQEPLGRVLLEAFASGCPVLATGVGGTPEIFEGLESWDLLAPPDSVDALAERLVRLLVETPRSTLNALRAQVRQIAEDRFSHTRSATELAAVYDQIAGVGSGPVPGFPR